MDLNRMKEMMGIKVTQPAKKSLANIHRITEASDGKKYAIIKEASEYVIKITESDSDELSVSDFKYIGGLDNKRDFIYNSYTLAEKQLALKVGLLKETYGTAADKPLIGSDMEVVEEAEVVFEKEVVFEGYNERKSYNEVDTRSALQLLKLVESDWGVDSNQYGSLKTFIIENFSTENLNVNLDERKTHLYNKMLGEMNFIDYAGNTIVEAAIQLEEEKYKLAIPAPKSDDEEVDADEVELGDEEKSDDKPFDDEPFDAGVEANEEEDPKKFIQQLAGKLGQSIRDYNGMMDEPDFDLEKFAINSVISATNTADMSEDDQNDIIDKIKTAGEGEVNGEMNGDDSEEDTPEVAVDMDAEVEPEGEVEESLTAKQSDTMDTDKDGDIDAKDLKTLRNETVEEHCNLDPEAPLSADVAVGDADEYMIEGKCKCEGECTCGKEKCEKCGKEICECGVKESEEITEEESLIESVIAKTLNELNNDK